MPKFLLTVLFILFFSHFSFSANQITITTYYPSPYGIYKELRLNPIPTAQKPNCDDTLKGSLYYDQDKDTLFVCSQDPSSGNTDWVPVPGGDNIYWLLNNSGDLYNVNSSGRVGINTTSINPLHGIFEVSHDGSSSDLVVKDNNGYVGIGTTSPDTKLDVNGKIRGELDIYKIGGTVNSSGKCFSCSGNDIVISAFVTNLDGCNHNPCDADLSISSDFHSICAGSNDNTGWVANGVCMHVSQ